jgi:hypothetical protein
LFLSVNDLAGGGCPCEKKKNSPAVAISAGLWYNTDKESAVWQTVSTFPRSQSQRMTARVANWRSFFVVEDLPRNIKHTKAYRCKQRKQS